MCLFLYKKWTYTVYTHKYSYIVFLSFEKLCQVKPEALKNQPNSQWKKLVKEIKIKSFIIYVNSKVRNLCIIYELQKQITIHIVDFCKDLLTPGLLPCKCTHSRTNWN